MIDLATPPALLQVKSVHKRYGGALALRGAQLEIRSPGRVHCLAGENGSGKSTMLGIVSGTVAPDSGALLLDGHSVSFRGPHDALKRGIAMVSQETTIAPDLSVTENILLGSRLVRSRFGINWRASRDRAVEVLELLELDYDPAARVGALAPHQRQMVEIARAISLEARLLILDEPTSSLTGDDVEALMTAIRRLAARGVAVLFVSHRLPEVFGICDDVTVLRDGRTVAEGAVDTFTADTLVHAMIGERPIHVRDRSRAIDSAATPALQLDRVSVPGVLQDINLQIQPGEIMGLAGLVASGRSELLEVIFGMRASVSGSFTLAGKSYRPTGPTGAIQAGIGFVPPDRKTQGLVLGMSVRDNLMLAATSGAAARKPPDRRRQNREWRQAVATMSIKAASPDVSVGTLSGGNQQKVALGKWVTCNPNLLLMDEPTRGVDVGAKAEIYDWLRRTADQGVAMIVSSSEYDELLELCDRILVLAAGRVIAELSASEATEAHLSALAGGAK